MVQLTALDEDASLLEQFLQSIQDTDWSNDNSVLYDESFNDAWNEITFHQYIDAMKQAFIAPVSEASKSKVIPVMTEYWYEEVDSSINEFDELTMGDLAFLGYNSAQLYTGFLGNFLYFIFEQKEDESEELQGIRIETLKTLYLSEGVEELLSIIESLGYGWEDDSAKFENFFTTYELLEDEMNAEEGSVLPSLPSLIVDYRYTFLLTEYGLSGRSLGKSQSEIYKEVFDHFAFLAYTDELRDILASLRVGFGFDADRPFSEDGLPNLYADPAHDDEGFTTPRSYIEYLVAEEPEYDYQSVLDDM